MFKPSIIHHRCGGRPAREALSGEFGLLCLNVHKNNQRAPFQSFFRQHMLQRPTDLILWQEAMFRGQDSFFLDRFCYEAAPNLQLKNHYYGVLTASDTQVINVASLLSFAQEIFIKTHKSALITYYSLGRADGALLCVANIHAINFRGLRQYQAEIGLLGEALTSHRGPLIVAGDFNSWSPRRATTLRNFCHGLSLQQATMMDGRLIKRFFGQPLDHVFYRGLELLEARCFSSEVYSDHNLLYTRFRSD
ncbi:endonuclease/exonuclease/phosphatase family protein [Pokkaliibacter sp. CJK22405]|uniref:endonuclease/exonuclease/phosphatase family protein n=1 Tax=Pokkaliibacter sp. CJK22405 TaxID=3384615 RepID=UPI0039851126